MFNINKRVKPTVLLCLLCIVLQMVIPSSIYYVNATANNCGYICMGECGKEGYDISWTLYQNGKLCISGDGEMKNWFRYDYVSWYSFRNNITNVEFFGNIRNIGDLAFNRCENLSSIVIPKSVEKIGFSAFYQSGLTEVYIPNSVKKLNISAFNGCESLKDVFYEGNEQQWNDIEQIQFHWSEQKDGCLSKAQMHYNSIIFSETQKHTLISAPDTDIKYEYNYSDDYFNHASNEFSTDLMQLSICFTVSAMVDDGGPYEYNAPSAAKQFFDDNSFDDYRFYGYDVKPATVDDDSAACVIGYKNIGETTLIAIAVRGAGYEGEWGSNFNVGSNGNHRGFSTASNFIQYYLNTFCSYFSKYFKSDIKFWVTGYSRGAAIANLVAASLNKGTDYSEIKKLNPNKDNVYAYTFETPQNTTDLKAHTSQYNNIFNIINPIDPVPKVAPSIWSFTRYGVDYVLPSAEVTYKYHTYFLPKMKEMYSMITGGDEYEEDFVYVTFEGISLLGQNKLKTKENYSVSQGVFLNMLFDAVAGNILLSRNNYSEKYQNTVTQLLKKYQLDFSDFPSPDYLWKCIKNRVDTSYYIYGAIKHDFDAKRLTEQLALALGDYMSIPYEDAYNLLSVIVDAPSAISNNVDVLVSAIYNENFSRLFIPHYTATTFAWVMACPDYILPATAYSKASFNCPVDVCVYDSNGILCASIENNEAAFFENSSVSAYIDKDGQKVFCLPPDEEFTFDVKGTDKGSMSCSFSKVDILDSSKSDITNYYELPVSEGADYSAVIETRTAIEDQLIVTVYNDDSKIEPSEIIDNDKKYTVSVSSNKPNCSVGGGGTYTKGEYAKVSAYAKDNYQFIGWYNGDTLVSTEIQYRFQIDNDILLQAVFSETVTLGDVNDDGTISAADARLALRRSVGLESYEEGSREFIACDVDHDGNISAADARLILRASVGLEDPKTWIK